MQKAVDAAIVKNLKADKKQGALLTKYLHARFSLTKNDRPHALRM